MENLSNISVIRDVLSRHGFSFSKGLGQNFLINPTVCPRMAEMGNAKPGWGIIEIGAGVGVLTAELARRADKVVCIEIDSRLLQCWTRRWQSLTTSRSSTRMCSRSICTG